jgi:hypothetical protein
MTCFEQCAVSSPLPTEAPSRIPSEVSVVAFDVGNSPTPMRLEVTPKELSPL